MSTESVMNIGTRLKAMREQRGLKAVFVAEKVGLSANMLSMIERERCNVTIQQAIALADFYNITLDNLVGRETDNRKSA